MIKSWLHNGLLGRQKYTGKQQEKFPDIIKYGILPFSKYLNDKCIAKSNIL